MLLGEGDKYKIRVQKCMYMYKVKKEVSQCFQQMTLCSDNQTTPPLN